MVDCVMGLFERYQTFVVGLLGFTGVIITISMNAKLARKQHERELSLERAALRAALISDLKILKNSYEDRIDMLKEEKCDGSVLIPENVSLEVYLQLLPRIGLLTPKEMDLVMAAYQLAGELPVRLNLLSENSINAHARPGYIEIDKSNISTASQLHKNILESIRLALSSINKHAPS